MQTYSGIAIDKPQHGNFERKKIASVGVCVCVRERERERVCVCEWRSERDRKCESVFPTNIEMQLESNDDCFIDFSLCVEPRERDHRTFTQTWLKSWTKRHKTMCFLYYNLMLEKEFEEKFDCCTKTNFKMLLEKNELKEGTLNDDTLKDDTLKPDRLKDDTLKDIT